MPLDTHLKKSTVIGWLHVCFLAVTLYLFLETLRSHRKTWGCFVESTPFHSQSVAARHPGLVVAKEKAAYGSQRWSKEDWDQLTSCNPRFSWSYCQEHRGLHLLP